MNQLKKAWIVVKQINIKEIRMRYIVFFCLIFSSYSFSCKSSVQDQENRSPYFPHLAPYLNGECVIDEIELSSEENDDIKQQSEKTNNTSRRKRRGKTETRASCCGTIG